MVPRISLPIAAATFVLASIGFATSHAAAAAPASSATGAEEVKVENDLYDFAYSYPAEAASIPDVKAFLDKERSEAEAELKEQAAEAKDAAEAEDFPYFPHYLAVSWGVEADLRGWLSLSAAVETYSGGAHGNHGFDGLLWDRSARRMRSPVSLFRSQAALRKALRPEFCRLLNEERAERREEPVRQDGEGPFDGCIDPLDGTIVLEATGGEAFDTILVLVPPYLAGPYVEGSYPVSVPVTLEILETLKPRFRRAFVASP